MTLLHDVAHVVRSMPDEIVARLDRFVARAHSPIDIDGDGMTLVCPHCEKPWPCAAFVDATQRQVG